MSKPSRKARHFDRDYALACKPRRLPVVRTEEKEEGKLYVTVKIRPARWVKWFGGREEVDRTFALDAIGGEVYEACDGKSQVKVMVREFAKTHKVSLAEAEVSVTSFLQTLMKKGLVAMTFDEEESTKKTRDKRWKNRSNKK